MFFFFFLWCTRSITPDLPCQGEHCSIISGLSQLLVICIAHCWSDSISWNSKVWVQNICHEGPSIRSFIGPWNELFGTNKWTLHSSISWGVMKVIEGAIEAKSSISWDTMKVIRGHNWSEPVFNKQGHDEGHSRAQDFYGKHIVSVVDQHSSKSTIVDRLRCSAMLNVAFHIHNEELCQRPSDKRRITSDELTDPRKDTIISCIGGKYSRGECLVWILLAILERVHYNISTF